MGCAGKGVRVEGEDGVSVRCLTLPKVAAVRPAPKVVRPWERSRYVCSGGESRIQAGEVHGEVGRQARGSSSRRCTRERELESHRATLSTRSLPFSHASLRVTECAAARRVYWAQRREVRRPVQEGTTERGCDPSWIAVRRRKEPIHEAARTLG